MPVVGQPAGIQRLIDTCRDAERGFRHAAQLISDRSLRSLFLDLGKRRAALASELGPHAAGETPAGGTAGAAVHRRWMEARTRLSGQDDRTVLAEALRGNRVTLRAFEYALATPLEPAMRNLVSRHYAGALDTHDDLERVLAEAF